MYMQLNLVKFLQNILQIYSFQHKKNLYNNQRYCSIPEGRRAGVKFFRSGNMQKWPQEVPHEPSTFRTKLLRAGQLYIVRMLNACTLNCC